MSFKKLVCVASVAVVLFTFAASAEVYSTTIGLRAEYGLLYGGELSFQQNVVGPTRIELGLAYNYGQRDDPRGICSARGEWTYLGAILSFQIYFPLGNADDFTWYIGPAAAATYGSYVCNANIQTHHFDGMLLDVGGVLGVEYDISAIVDQPVVVSFDIRPLFGFKRTDAKNDKEYFRGSGAGLAIRWGF